MGSVRVLGMAMVAALTPLAAVAPEALGVSSPNPSLKLETVKCEENTPSKQITVSAPGVVVVECPQTYTFEPQVTGTPANQQVYDTSECNHLRPLISYCPDATLEDLPEKVETPEGTTKTNALPANEETKTLGATLTIKTLPVEKTAVFYVQCKPRVETGDGHRVVGKQACVVTVTVEKAPTQGGGEAVVHVCTQPNASISVSVPDEGSSVQFACASQFTLYPSDAKRVFKDDCKTEESLKNMTRTNVSAAAPPASTPQAGAPKATADNGEQSAASSSAVYALTADKKPPKRRLCYLCARENITAQNKGTAEDYCMIYVESSARTRWGLRVALALVLSCVLALLPTT